MGIILKLCKGCYLLDHTDDSGLCCAELGKTADSLRCICYDNPATSDKVQNGILNDLENYQERG